MGKRTLVSSCGLPFEQQHAQSTALTPVGNNGLRAFELSRPQRVPPNVGGSQTSGDIARHGVGWDADVQEVRAATVRMQEEDARCRAGMTLEVELRQAGLGSA